MGFSVKNYWDGIFGLSRESSDNQSRSRDRGWDISDIQCLHNNICLTVTGDTREHFYWRTFSTKKDECSPLR